ncbi:hypothetical protein BHYA_0782g00030 [Botrytis hyacinthi]|uniref:Uncharacterized protein n=1 Tax=Botrytis hyacinthi TaxID=278943 RepID=A0A4Z1GBM2_9HELO|nr:hypothetical protein BHYA_0782g00030 [Botrytis hyacinthi]
MLFNLCSTNFKYSSIENDDPSFTQRFSHSLSHALRFWREAIIICLVVICTILTTEDVYMHSHLPQFNGVKNYHLTSEKNRWRQFQWNTNLYSSADPQNEDYINAAWDQIVPAFGIVAVDHEWAAEHNLPASMSLPSNASRGVYIVDAYHQIHCLTIIRKTLVELASGRPLSKPVQHSKHCFDSLLQYIICGNSGDTLLYTLGNNETGNGQLRNCIDWNSRKHWVKSNSACYADGDHPIPLYDHFDHCENKDDGIHLYSNL